MIGIKYMRPDLLHIDLHLPTTNRLPAPPSTWFITAASTYSPFALIPDLRITRLSPHAAPLSLLP